MRAGAAAGVRLRAGRGPADFAALAAIWRGAVDATHDFLDPADRDDIAARLDDYFAAVALTVAEVDGRPAGFSGVHGDALEMLFVAPAYHRRGVGTALLRHATDERGVRRVDVNEQNPGALAFYLARGFREAGRSPRDEAGRPYPLLHLRRAPG